MSKTSKIVTKTIASVLSLAMVVTSLSITGTVSEAKAKIKSVKVKSPVTNGGKLVLKKGQKKRIKVKVTKSGKISKKVTYKSKNTKVAKIVKSKGKVFVKAVGKKGKSTKIQIISKANKKKKATLKVKVGTPIKKVSISKFKVTKNVEDTNEADASKRNKKTSKTTKFKSYKKTTLTLTEKYTDDSTEKNYSEEGKITVKYSPTKVGYKGMKWKAKNSKVVYVSPDGYVTPNKAGSTIIYGYTKDGTNKKVKLKVTVKKAPFVPTPVPVIEEDPRVATTIEDFEKYPVGTKWSTYTAGGYANSGTMTVVQDPENSKNKVLKIDYTGKDQAYDFAPVFNITLPNGKKLKDYSAIRLKSRVIANTADCNYKTIGVYFDGYKTIKSTDFFYTANYDGSSAKKAPKQDWRFGSKISMATGVDKNYNVPTEVKAGNAVQDKNIIETSPGKKYNNKVFPTYYQDYGTKNDKTAVSPGYSETETNADNKVGFQQNTLEFDTTRIGDAWITGSDTTTPLLDRNQIDMVLGGTYKGSAGLTPAQYTMVLYLDDIQVMSGAIPCKSMKFVDPPVEMACGTDDIPRGVATLELSYEPLNTTQRDVTYTSSDASLATVDAEGTVTANNEAKEGKVTITATNKANSAVKATATIEIKKLQPAAEDYDILTNASTKVVPKSEDEKVKLKSNIDATLAGGQLTFNYDALNQSVLIDLGKTINLAQYKGVEITGNVPSQIGIEFYSSKLDMTQTKDNGSEKDWWDTMSGKTYPFYIGSTTQRTEQGGFERSILVDRGIVDANGKAKAEDETLRYSLKKLGEGGTGDWSAIRYIIIKSNQPPGLPLGAYSKDDVKGDARTKFLHTIKSLKLTAREVFDCDNQNRYTIITDKDENVAGTSTDGTAKAFYVDNVSEDNPLAKHKTQKDLQDFRYIKVVVKDAAKVKVGLLKDGEAIDDYTLVGESTGETGEKTVYYRIDNLGEDIDIHNVDAIAVDLPEGGTVSKLYLAQGMICYNATEPKQYEVIDGTETPVTLAAYGDK